MPAFGRSLTVILFVALALAGAGTTPGAAHTAGECVVDVTVDRCEAWAQTYDDAEIRPPDRSDQFVADVAATGSTVFLAVKDVALNPDDPYAATGSWAVVAYDAESGDLRWESRRASRVYDFPTDVAVAPDGRHIYVTGAAYNAFSVSATDSRMVSVAYDAATGA